MPHRLHLCVLAAENPSRVQVCRRGPHWLWPMRDVDGRARLPMLGARYLGNHVAFCHPRCVTYPTVVTPQLVEWLGLYEVDSTSRLPGCDWVDVSTLRESDAVLAYQGRALSWYHAGLSGARPVGPFESTGALERIRAWVADQLGMPLIQVGQSTAYRLTAHEAVIGFEVSSSHRVYFKAQNQRPFRDALVSQLLNRVVPGVAAQTLAWSEARGWWLIDHVDGLAASPRWDTRTALRVVETVAEIQQTLRTSTAELVAAGAMPVTVRLLDEQLHYILDHLGDCTGFPVRELTQHFVCAKTVLAEFDDRTWNHNDLAPQNIGVTANDITFIDHEIAAVGPALISVPRLAQTCQTATGAPDVDWIGRCTTRLTAACTSPTGAAYARLATAAAVVQLALQSAHLQSTASEECGSPLDRLALRAAERMVVRLRSPAAGRP